MDFRQMVSTEDWEAPRKGQHGDPGGFPEAVMREWILENAELTGITAEEAKRVKIADVASVKLLREVQEEMGIVCEGGYNCKK